MERTGLVPVFYNPDPETAKAMGACAGADAAAQKVDILLGPGLNTKRTGGIRPRQSA